MGEGQGQMISKACRESRTQISMIYGKLSESLFSLLSAENKLQGHGQILKFRDFFKIFFHRWNWNKSIEYSTKFYKTLKDTTNTIINIMDICTICHLFDKRYHSNRCIIHLSAYFGGIQRRPSACILLSWAYFLDQRRFPQIVKYLLFLFFLPNGKE